MRLSWEEYALKLAETASLRSEDPFVRVGACVLRHDNSVAAVGYNGAPPGIEINWEDRDSRRPFVSHAECSALRYCKPKEARLIAVTLFPCESCMMNIAMYGINKIVYRDMYDKAKDSQTLADFFKIETIKL